jgi:hypothetical protein
MQRGPNDLLMRAGLILLVTLWGFMIGNLVAKGEIGFVDFLNLGLSLFDILGAMLLLRLDR